VLGVYILVWFVNGFVCLVCRVEGLSLPGGGFVGAVKP
jgi:hypothetical protein